MTAYHYQCSNCSCTLFADDRDEGEDWTYVMNGELCSSCQAQQDAANYYDEDDDD